MRTVTLTLAGRDLVELAEALSALGFWPVEQGLAWLLAEGARHYLNDRRVREGLEHSAGSDPDPTRAELLRREAASRLFSIRARALVREIQREPPTRRVMDPHRKPPRVRRGPDHPQPASATGPGVGSGADVAATVHLAVEDAVWSQVQRIPEREGWDWEDGLRILLGYGAAVHLLLPPADPPRPLRAAGAGWATPSPGAHPRSADVPASATAPRRGRGPRTPRRRHRVP